MLFIKLITAALTSTSSGWLFYAGTTAQSTLPLDSPFEDASIVYAPRPALSLYNTARDSHYKQSKYATLNNLYRQPSRSQAVVKQNKVISKSASKDYVDFPSVTGLCQDSSRSNSLDSLCKSNSKLQMSFRPRIKITRQCGSAQILSQEGICTCPTGLVVKGKLCTLINPASVRINAASSSCTRGQTYSRAANSCICKAGYDIFESQCIKVSL